MKPRRTHESTAVLRLPGGTEDNDLWATPCLDADDHPCTETVWQPSPEERDEIAAGAAVGALWAYAMNRTPETKRPQDAPRERRQV